MGNEKPGANSSRPTGTCSPPPTFFAVEVWGLRGLVTFYVFFVTELETRKIAIAGITPGPNEAWIVQVGRNLTDPVDGFLADKRYLICDRDSKYCSSFQDMLKDAGIQVVRLPHRSPNLNAYAERFVRSVKEECLGKLILFGERSRRRAISEYAAHYHEERNHQGLGSRLIGPEECVESHRGRVSCRHRLGGMLRYYRRQVA